MNGDAKRWFAVRVRANFEQSVCAALKNKGVEPFLPTYRDRRTWSDRTKIIEVPLFPGYLFCRTHVEDRLPVLTTPGVKEIVGVGKVPAPIPDYEIHAVKSFIEQELDVKPWPFLRVGQPVTIQRGPLAGVEGIVEEFRGNYRVIVSITLLQRSIAAEVDGSWIRGLAA
jgi:transcription antitermination factor NusG